jgi:hypothetical protein
MRGTQFSHLVTVEAVVLVDAECVVVDVSVVDDVKDIEEEMVDV